MAESWNFEIVHTTFIYLLYLEPSIPFYPFPGTLAKVYLSP